MTHWPYCLHATLHTISCFLPPLPALRTSRKVVGPPHPFSPRIHNPFHCVVLSWPVPLNPGSNCMDEKFRKNLSYDCCTLSRRFLKASFEWPCTCSTRYDLIGVLGPPCYFGCPIAPIFSGPLGVSQYLTSNPPMTDPCFFLTTRTLVL